MSTLLPLTKYWQLLEADFNFEAYYDGIVSILLACPIELETRPTNSSIYYKDKYTGLYFEKQNNLRHTESHHVHFNKVFCELSDWFEDSSIDIVPACYAESLGLTCVDIKGNGIDLNDSDIKFSRSNGYYNSDTHVIIDYDLLDKEDCCLLENGDWVHSDDAVWCKTEEEFHHQNDVNDCLDDDGRTVYAPNDNMWAFLGTRYHNSVSTYDCECCGECYPQQDAHYGEYCSEHCYNESNSNSSLERESYSSNVLNYKGIGDSTYLLPRDKNTYSNQRDNALRCGIELETFIDYDNHDTANDFARDCEYAIATEDGSLDNDCGCEYIFRPETLAQQLLNVNDFLNKNGDNIDSRIRMRYGLHVHVSSFFMSKIDKMKLISFTFKYIDFITKIGGRVCDECSYNSPANIEKSRYASDKGLDKYRLPSNRTQAINLQNSNTVEFRYPVASNDAKHINRNIELAWALSLFCTYQLNFAMLHNDTALSAFMSYVVSNSKQYANLTEWLLNETQSTTNSEAA